MLAAGPKLDAIMRLLVDLGGTNTRCLFAEDSGDTLYFQSYLNDDFASFLQILETFYSHAESSLKGRRIESIDAGFAIAAPISGDAVILTNRDWHFSRSSLQSALGLRSLLFINDFTANALSIPRLQISDYSQLGGGKANAEGAIGVLGPGTGLGVSGLVRSDEQWLPLASEGGHVTLAAANDREAQVLSYLRKRYSHVSAEKVLSGFGLSNLYHALTDLQESPCEADTTISAAEICQQASDGDNLASEALTMFFAFLGTVAGDLALTLGATGGIYLAGGILPRLEQELAASQFRQRFEAKDRYSDYLANIPTFLITHREPALIGLNTALDQQHN